MAQKFFIILILSVILFIFISCDNSDIDTDEQPITFMEVGEVSGGTVVYCEQTDVMYIYSTGASNFGSYM